MAIIHKGKNTYFYRSVRKGDKVTSEYVAAGEQAHLQAILDAADREEEERRRRREARWRRELARERARLREKLAEYRAELRATQEGRLRALAAEDAPIVELFGWVDAAFRGAMYGAGYAQHERGAWRKRRGGDMATATANRVGLDRAGAGVGGVPPGAEPRAYVGSGSGALATQARGEGGPLAVAAPETREELAADANQKLVAIRDLARKGDPRGLEFLRRFREASPDLLVEAFGGDLGRRVEARLLDRASGGDPATRAAVEAHVEGRRTSLLGGPDPGPVERLLVGRLVLCCLDADLADLDALGGPRPDAEVPGSMRVAEFLDRRRDRAHKRVAMAAKALATARRAGVAGREAGVGAGGCGAGSVGGRDGLGGRGGADRGTRVEVRSEVRVEVGVGEG